MTSDTMSIERYLAEGGKLSAPENTPPRYRAELMKLMASFVDSSLAGAAGFADVINAGPGIKERIAAAKIVLEKTDNADKVLRVMADFGTDTARYANAHPWAARLPRDADIGAKRTDQDMRLAVFNYPLQGWGDAVVMNLLMGLAVGVQLKELCRVSYQPLGDAFREIAPIERHHVDLAIEGMERLTDSADRAELQASLSYWRPRVAASFGQEQSDKFARLQSLGLRHQDNASLRQIWQARTDETLAALGLTA